AGRTRGVPTGVRRVAAPAEADALAAHLLDPDRPYPVVVVSIPGGRAEPWIDAAEIATATQGIAEVVLLPTDESSRHLAASLPEMTQVYGGAGRVYPVGLAWTGDPYLSPLRFAYGPSEADRATQALISDALTMGATAGLATTDAPTVRAQGTVRMLVPPSRAVVLLQDGELATVWQELTAPDVPLERLFVEQMVLSGELDLETHRLDVTGALGPGSAAVAHYRPGDVVLASVRDLRPDVVHLALHPDVVVPVPRDRVTGNPSDSLTALFTRGETVLARVAWLDGPRPALRLDDIDDDEAPVTAPALLTGGPPWLVPPALPGLPTGETGPDATSAATAPWTADLAAPPAPPAAGPRPRAAPGAVRSLSLTLDTARAESIRLQAELQVASAALAAAEAERDALRHQVRVLTDDRQRLLEQVAAQKTHLRRRMQSAGVARRAQQEVERVAPARDFTDPVRQLEHEIYLEWVARFGAEEKDARPLAPHSVGPGFLASLDAVEGVSRQTVLRVVVEVLTGVAEQLAGREVHRLRTGSGGDAPPVARPDGATCWRASIQQGSPSARRLHYWKLGDHIELSRVALHDDFRP
ncbi:MAG TPA: hypothetical protein VN257_11625, partial [Actinotalea sp.]|nr:hypothetical protein [Actinotalea sp.]